MGFTAGSSEDVVYERMPPCCKFLYDKVRGWSGASLRLKSNTQPTRPPDLFSGEGVREDKIIMIFRIWVDKGRMGNQMTLRKCQGRRELGSAWHPLGEVSAFLGAKEGIKCQESGLN